MSDIRFEFARKEHLAEIKAISNQTYREHSVRNPDAFGGEFATNPLEPFFENSFASSEVSDNIIVARKGAVVVGHVVFIVHEVPSERTKTVENEACIWDISFLPDYRGQGLGKRAFDFLIPVLKERDVTRISAEIWSGNVASERVFESAGFGDAYKVVRLRLGEPKPLLKPDPPPTAKPVEHGAGLGHTYLDFRAFPVFPALISRPPTCAPRAAKPRPIASPPTARLAMRASRG